MFPQLIFKKCRACGKVDVYTIDTEYWRGSQKLSMEQEVAYCLAGLLTMHTCAGCILWPKCDGRGSLPAGTPSA